MVYYKVRGGKAMKTTELKRATKRTKDAQLTVRFGCKDIFKNWIHRARIFFEGNSKGEVNLFAIVAIIYLVLMVIVLLAIF